VILLTAAQSGQALVLSRTTMPTMNAAADAAKQAWLTKLDKPSWGPSGVTPAAPVEVAAAAPVEDWGHSTPELHNGVARNKVLELDLWLEEMRQLRGELSSAIAEEEAEKAGILDEMHTLNEQLCRINESLARKLASHAEYDSTIREAEKEYAKIQRNSQTLLHVLSQRNVSIGQEHEHEHEGTGWSSHQRVRNAAARARARQTRG